MSIVHRTHVYKRFAVQPCFSFILFETEERLCRECYMEVPVPVSSRYSTNKRAVHGTFHHIIQFQLFYHGIYFFFNRLKNPLKATVNYNFEFMQPLEE